MNEVPLQVRISGGNFRSPFRRPGLPRLSPAEREAIALQMTVAREAALAGDDSQLRSLTEERFAVECVSDIGAFGGAMRKRKFSNPFFLTPQGELRAFPEEDKALFSTQEQAETFLKSRVSAGEWEIRQTSLSLEMRDKRYLRWVKEVKDQEYTEPRRGQAELADIYANGGIAALFKIYSKAHALKLAKRLELAKHPSREGAPVSSKPEQI